MAHPVIPFLGLARQYPMLKDELLMATDQVLSSGILMDGFFTTELENWLKARTGALHAVTCHSGTQALEIIAKFRFNRFKEYHGFSGEAPEVLLPNLSYPATLNAWLSAGWNVRLIDTDKDGLMLRLGIDRRLAGVIECPVGLFGASPNCQDIWDHGTIYDGAQHWLIPNESFGYAMAISFDPTKNLPSSGNGGAIITDHERLADFAREYRSNGKEHHDYPGSNSRMSEQNCAQTLVRVNHIDQWQHRRDQIKRYWLEQFREMPFRCMSAGIERHADQKFVLWSEHRNELRVFLTEYGIETKIHYPLTLGELPIAKNIPHPDAMSMSVMLSRGFLSLPIYPELSDSEIEYVANTVKGFFRD